MSDDRFDVLERLAPLFEAPEPSFEGFIRRRDRKRRNQRIAAGVVAIAIFAAPAWIVARGGWSDRSQTPAVPGPSEAPVVVVIDQAFVDSINGCERLLVTPQEVQSALDFRAMDPTPYQLGGTPHRLGVAEPLSTGCEYASLDVVPNFGQVVIGHDGLGGQLVITAYLADAPPSPLGRGSTLQGLGDEARFTHYGNGDGHLYAPEGATSILEVRSGDLILRFNGGSFNIAENVVVSGLTGYPLPALRQLAESALTTLGEMPAGSGPRLAPGTTSRPFFLDLRTGEQTPLPESIAVGHDYVASPDGTRLAYEGIGDDGSPQIFIAGTDGTDVRQVTHDPIGATHPAWSPDGKIIAYEGYEGGGVRQLFMLDVATGESTQIFTDEGQEDGGPQFTSDGSVLVYSGGGSLWTVPFAGGKGTLLIGPGEGVNDAGNGSLSPDGSLVTFLGSGWPESEQDSSGRSFHCGPCRFVANADGTERRVIPGWISNPAGIWSPDSTRIVCLGSGINTENRIIVVDVATGDARRVAEGRGATWFDDHTLLVDVNGGPLALS